jgi:hypothetical protein
MPTVIHIIQQPRLDLFERGVLVRRVQVRSDETRTVHVNYEYYS